MKNTLFLSLTILIFSLTNCNYKVNDSSEKLEEALDRIEELEGKLENLHTPGWGETMRGSTQIHHSNLWFAGMAENWELADHMLHEIEEGFEKLEKWYPNDERTTFIPMIYEAIEELEDVVELKDKAEFEKGFELFTNTCNTCHKATGNGIYVIQKPTEPGYTNQRMEVQLDY
ncbi:MAG: hypothetical protein WC994_04085 [Brumimicrobium sp.]